MPKSSASTTASAAPAPYQTETSTTLDPPPEYSDSPAPSRPAAAETSSSPNTQAPAISIPGLTTLRIPLDQYTPANSTLSSDRATLTIEDTVLAKSPARLVSLIRSQAALPPIPEVHIRGSNFDIRLNLLRYLVPEEAHAVPGAQGSALAPAPAPVRKWNYTRLTTEKCPQEAAKKANAKPAKVPAAAAAVDGGSDGIRLEALAKAFCGDLAADKMFVLTRTVTNWDQEYIIGCVRNLLAELGYGGRVDVSFPVAHQRVIVTPQPNLLERFMAVFNKPRSYEALESVWPYASAAPPSGELETAGSSHAPRVFAVRSERAWWREWQPAIERAILSHRKGIVGLDDLLEVRLGYPGPARPLTGWGKHEY